MSLRLKQQIFEGKVGFNRFRFTIFEWLLIAAAIYFFLVVKPQSIIQVLVLIIAVVVHEIAHAFVAKHKGDPTAERQGRISLNPLVHIDPLGSIFLPLILIISGSPFLLGWAKPVPVDTRYFKAPIKDMMWVALAGPLSNLSLAFLSGLCLKVLLVNQPSIVALNYIVMGLEMSIVINLVLTVFNCIPIPPLDGSKIIMPILPYRAQATMMRLEPYGLFIILIAMFFGLFDWVLSIVMPLLLKLII